MQLPPVGFVYVPESERARNDELEKADRLNRKRREDLEVVPPERFILSSPDGTRWSITVSNVGVLTATALP